MENYISIKSKYTLNSVGVIIGNNGKFIYAQGTLGKDSRGILNDTLITREISAERARLMSKRREPSIHLIDMFRRQYIDDLHRVRDLVY